MPVAANDGGMVTAGFGKTEVLECLERQHIAYELTEHGEVRDMSALARMEEMACHPGALAKNLLVCDGKKSQYRLLVVKGDKRIDLKAFRRDQGTRRLTFAAAEDLMGLMGLVSGEVSPFGVLNDERRVVHVCIDADFLGDSSVIGVHPNDNTATVWLALEDLVGVIEGHGNEVSFVRL